MIFAFYTVSLFKAPSEGSLGLGSTKAQIAVVEVNGVILTSKDVVAKLEKANKSKDIKAIIVRVNSPGGAVGPSQEIYEEMRRIDTDKEKGKPVYASFGSVAASGGYYIGAAARKIYSNPGTLTGSIGVIMQFMDLSKLYEWAKINPDTIKAGKYKDVGQPSRAITEEEKSMLEGLLGGVHDQFISHIMEVRKGKVKGDIKEHAQGQIFSGKKAMELGLVDELAGLWEAGRRIHKELKLEGEFGLRFIKKKKKFSVLDFMDSLDGLFGAMKSTFGQNKVPMFLYNTRS